MKRMILFPLVISLLTPMNTVISEGFDIGSIRFDTFGARNEYSYLLTVLNNYEQSADFYIRIYFKLGRLVQEQMSSTRKIKSGMRTFIQIVLNPDYVHLYTSLNIEYSDTKDTTSTETYNYFSITNRQIDGNGAYKEYLSFLFNPMGKSSTINEFFDYSRNKTKYVLKNDLKLDFSVFKYRYSSQNSAIFDKATLTLKNMAIYFKGINNENSDAVFKLKTIQEGNYLYFALNDYFYDVNTLTMSENKTPDARLSANLYLPDAFKEVGTIFSAEINITNFAGKGYSYSHSFFVEVGEKFFGDNGIWQIGVGYNV